jgi:predicted nucleic acid-binding protein
MRRYLLDTNHLSHAIGRISPLRERIRDMRRRGFRFATCWPVLFELEMGIIRTKNPAVPHHNLKTLLREVRISPLDWHVMEKVGEVHLLVKQRGRVLSLADKTVAAIAMLETATVLSADLDFSALPEIRTENWL